MPKKAQALLAYLALSGGRPVPRDQLAGFLWCLNSPEQARQNLRQCLAMTRAALGEAGRSAIEASAAGIRLSPAARALVDVTRFEALAQSRTIGELVQAHDLYGDGLLPGLEIASEPCNEWLAIERTRLANLYLDALGRLAEARAAAGDSEAAIATARQFLQREPLREDGHRLLMRLYAAAGRRGEALRQVQLCTEILRRELDVAPDQETAALAEQIRAGFEAPLGAATASRDEPHSAFAVPVHRAGNAAVAEAPRPLPQPWAAAATLVASALLLAGFALAYLPPAAGSLGMVANQRGSNGPTLDGAAASAITASAPSSTAGSGGVDKAVLSDGDRRDCSGWRAKAGYSVDYIVQRTGKRQPGFAIEWLSNIGRGEVEPGDVAIFDAWHGHTAYVEQVERDGNGKPARLLVSSWNKPGNWLDVACVVTEGFGRTSTFWVDANTASRYWRPSLALPTTEKHAQE